jgi:PAP2 superfamily
VLLVLVGFTRMALGVHYLTDVLAGWALGVVWLAVTAAAFHRWRQETGNDALALAEGLEPEAAAHRTPGLSSWSRLGSAMGSTEWVIVGCRHRNRRLVCPAAIRSILAEATQHNNGGPPTAVAVATRQRTTLLLECAAELTVEIAGLDARDEGCKGKGFEHEYTGMRGLAVA